jgi:hypothetical protein
VANWRGLKNLWLVQAQRMGLTKMRMASASHFLTQNLCARKAWGYLPAFLLLFFMIK